MPRTLTSSILVVLVSSIWACAAIADGLPVVGPEIQLGEVSQTTRGDAQREPDVACNDERCLVVWLDAHSRASWASWASGWQIMAAFVEADGRRGQPFRIAHDTDPWSFLAPSVAADGLDFIVAWGWSSRDAGDAILATRVSGDGTVSEPLRVADGDLHGHTYWDPAIATSADGYALVVWSEAPRPPVQLDTYTVAALIGPDDRVSERIVLSDRGSTSHLDRLYPSVASDGVRFLVTWLQRLPRGDGDPQRAEMRAVLVETDGTLGEQLALGFNDAPFMAPASVAGDSDGFAVAWDTPRTPGADEHELDVVVAYVASDGAVRTGEVAIPYRSGIGPHMPTLAIDPEGRHLLTWIELPDDPRASGASLRGAWRGPDGAWGPEATLASLVAPPYAPVAIARLADGFLVALEDVGHQEDAVLVRLDAAGRALGAPHTVATGGTQSNPQVVATADEGFVVVWAQHPEGDASSAIAARVDAQGHELGRSSLTLHTASYCLRAAGNAQTVLVTGDGAFTREESPVGLWLDGDGRPVGTLALPVHGVGRFRTCLPAATDGARFLVAWSESDGTAARLQRVRVAVVEPGATSGEPLTVAELPYGASVETLRVAGADGAGFLVAWRAAQYDSPEPGQALQDVDLVVARVSVDGVAGEPGGLVGGASRVDVDPEVDLVALLGDAEGFTAISTRAWLAESLRLHAARVGLDGSVARDGDYLPQPDDGGPERRAAFVGGDGQRWLAVGGDSDRGSTFKASLWGRGLQARLGVPSPSSVTGTVDLAGTPDHALAVYTRDYIVYTRRIGRALPEPVEPPADEEPVPDAEVERDAPDTPPDTSSPVFSQDETDAVGRGCCSQVRPANAGDTPAAWGVLALVTLLGLRRRRRPRPQDHGRP